MIEQLKKNKTMNNEIHDKIIETLHKHSELKSSNTLDSFISSDNFEILADGLERFFLSNVLSQITELVDSSKRQKDRLNDFADKMQCLLDDIHDYQEGNITDDDFLKSYIPEIKEFVFNQQNR